ncbi:TPA: hypothetical protein LT061_004828 [Salmonella enterica subsp. enterica serovar Blitta]|nr:hypothetical protein [Salmonella enterica subsp. enterica serovar Blitta]
MSDTGVRIFHNDGTHFDFNERSTVCYVPGIGSYPGFVESDYNVFEHTIKTSLRVPEGYDWWLWQTYNVNQCWGYWLGHVSPIITRPTGPVISSAFLDNNRYINVKWRYSPGLDDNGETVRPMWQIPDTLYGGVVWPVSQPREYGFQIFGVDNLAGIFDTSLVSYLLWKGEVDIHDGWSPASINPAFSMNNVLCFLYTTDPYAVISIEGNNRYRVWYKGWKYNGAIRAKICIFGNGQPLSPVSDYGIEVFNPATGKLVYNSGRDVLIRPKLVPMSAGGVMSGNNISYPPITVPGISRPMYAPTNISSGIGAGVTHDERGDDVSIFYLWVTSNGRSLYLQPSGHRHHYYERALAYDHPRLDHTPSPVMVIDAEDYFVF